MLAFEKKSPKVCDFHKLVVIKEKMDMLLQLDNKYLQWLDKVFLAVKPNTFTETHVFVLLKGFHVLWDGYRQRVRELMLAHMFMVQGCSFSLKPLRRTENRERRKYRAHVPFKFVKTLTGIKESLLWGKLLR